MIKELFEQVKYDENDITGIEVLEKKINDRISHLLSDLEIDTLYKKILALMTFRTSQDIKSDNIAVEVYYFITKALIDEKIKILFERGNMENRDISELHDIFMEMNKKNNKPFSSDIKYYLLLKKLEKETQKRIPMFIDGYFIKCLDTGSDNINIIGGIINSYAINMDAVKELEPNLIYLLSELKIQKQAATINELCVMAEHNIVWNKLSTIEDFYKLETLYVLCVALGLIKKELPIDVNIITNAEDKARILNDFKGFCSRQIINVDVERIKKYCDDQPRVRKSK